MKKMNSKNQEKDSLEPVYLSENKIVVCRHISATDGGCVITTETLPDGRSRIVEFSGASIDYYIDNGYVIDDDSIIGGEKGPHDLEKLREEAIRGREYLKRLCSLNKNIEEVLKVWGEAKSDEEIQEMRETLQKVLSER